MEFWLEIILCLFGGIILFLIAEIWNPLVKGLKEFKENMKTLPEDIESSIQSLKMSTILRALCYVLSICLFFWGVYLIMKFFGIAP